MLSSLKHHLGNAWFLESLPSIDLDMLEEGGWDNYIFGIRFDCADTCLSVFFCLHKKQFTWKMFMFSWSHITCNNHYLMALKWQHYWV